MNWQEFLHWSRIGFIACCALVLQLVLSLAVGEHAREAGQLRPGASPVRSQSTGTPATLP